MKRYFLLFAMIVLAHGTMIAQTYLVGDYRTLTFYDDTYLQWEDPVNWEECTVAGSPGTWVPASGYPNGSEANIYIRQNTVLTGDFTLEVGSKIWITDNGINPQTLFIGFNVPPDFVLPIYFDLYGEIDIELGDFGLLNIPDGSSMIIHPEGKITDHAANITNENTAGGIYIIASTGNLTGSLITSTSGLTGYYDQKISAGRWHMISSPFNNTIAGDFSNGANNAYIKTWSPNVGWENYISSLTTDITEGRGYLLWENAALTFSKNGVFNNGTMNLPISAGVAGDNWNFLGNPYPCGLDWSSISEKTNAEGGAFMIYDGTQYISNNGTFSTAVTDADPIIPPFQGFFIRYASGSDITIDASNKVHTSNVLYKKQQIENWTNHIKLVAEFGDQSARTVFYQQNEATNGKDEAFDAPMMFSGSESTLDVYSFAGDQPTSINAYGEYPYVMELGIKVPTGGGEITLRPTDLRNIDANLLVYLQDKETGDYFNFIDTPSYTFNAMGGDVIDRIFLIFNNNVGVGDLDKEAIHIYSHKKNIYLNFTNNQFKGTLKVYNLLGQTVYSNEVSNATYSPIHLDQSSGYYLVELITENENITQKVFIQQ
ncbi:MAG: T9SS type A sorting domain-containing protein [Bacteroidales bacterium]|nr:T9SS type A sorting domain-containing protein [Bacteroidales bacterium]